MSSAFHVAMRLDDVAERKAGVDQRPDFAGGHERPDIVPHTCNDPILCGHRAVAQRRGEQRCALFYHHAERDHSLSAALQADHGHAAIKGERVDIAGEIGGADHVKDDIDTTALAKLADNRDKSSLR